jgi:class 3 adenylate cyclase
MSQKVAFWLEKLGLDQYSVTFEENAIDWELLPELDQETLKDIGVKIAGHRLRILKAASEITEGQSTFTSEADPVTRVEAETKSLPGEDATSWSRTPGERKPVTMLFADIVGSTSLTEKMDAEEAHELLYRATQLMCEAVENNEGTVCRFMGDGLMAMFGAPVASEWHAIEACRAALQMQESIRGYCQELVAGHDKGLSIRVGLNSGEVVVLQVGDDPSHPEYDASGPTVPLAARMEQSAEADTILITGKTLALTRNQTQAKTRDPVSVKGFTEPVAVFELTGLKSSAEADDSTLRQPMVGRQAELSQVRGLLEICRETGRGQIVLVRGDPGIGKSRFIDEIAMFAKDFGYQCHKTFVLDFGAGKGQEAIPVIARSLLGIPPGSGKQLRMKALEDAVSEHTVLPEQRVFLNDLLDLTQPLEYRTLYDAMGAETRKAGKRKALQDMLCYHAGRQPVLILVEDLHWIDDLSLDYLAALGSVSAELPIAMLMTSRVENDPVDSGWRSKIDSTAVATIDLRPLRQEDSLRLVARFIDENDDLAQQCIARAAGNPLFLNQLLLNITSGGDDLVPDSIKSLVQARMDQLAPTDNNALKAASVLGQRFHLDAMRYLVEDSDFDCESLLANQLLRQEGKQYLFAHALIQEAAYNSLLKQQRRDWHLRAADWYRESDLILYAEHLDKAGATEAAKAYHAAALEQLKKLRLERASQVILAGVDNASESDRVELEILQGEVLRLLGRNNDSVELYRSLRDQALDQALICRVLVELSEGLDALDLREEMIATLDRAEPIAVANDRFHELARIYRLRSSDCFFSSDQAGCERTSKKMLEYAQRSGDLELEARALSSLGDAEYLSGRFVSAKQLFSQCLEIAEANGYGRMLGANLMMLGYISHFENDVEVREQTYERASDLAVKAHDLRGLMHTRTGGIWWGEMGNIEKAHVLLNEARALCQTMGTRMFEAEVTYLQAYNNYLEGNDARALALSRESVEMLMQTEGGMTFRGPTALGVNAIMETNDVDRHTMLHMAEELLSKGCVFHNYLEFYEFAIEASLRFEEWDEALRFARTLEKQVETEPLARCELLARRGRLLAEFWQGRRDDAFASDLRCLHEQFSSLNMLIYLPKIESAISDCEN